MHVAVCTNDTDARYNVSRLVYDTLLSRGILAEITLFPMLTELYEASLGGGFVDIAVIIEPDDTQLLRNLCRILPVILVGKSRDGPTAYEICAKYYIESPVDRIRLDKALTRCITKRK